MKVLITGKNGQLGKEFCKVLSEKNIEFKAFGRQELNIENFRQVTEAVETFKPDVIINCAAYNFVDKAETEYELAFRTNTIGVENLAIAAKKVNAFLIHYSTDYVFDGTKENYLYTEEDKPNPLNQYGKSKLEGEKRVKENLENYLIFRVSWVYGSGKQNFIHKVITWSQNNTFLKIACDEFSIPTSTETIVNISLKALKERLTGLYHLTNTNFTSRFEWAREIFKALKINKFIRPVSADIFNLPAKRPKFSPMSNEKIKKELNIEIEEWQEALRRFLRKEFTI